MSTRSPWPPSGHLGACPHRAGSSTTVTVGEPRTATTVVPGRIAARPPTGWASPSTTSGARGRPAAGPRHRVLCRGASARWPGARPTASTAGASTSGPTAARTGRPTATSPGPGSRIDVLAAVDHLGLRAAVRPSATRAAVPPSCWPSRPGPARSRPSTASSRSSCRPHGPVGRRSDNPLSDGARRRRETFPSAEDAFVNFSSKPPFADLDPEVLELLRRGRIRADPAGRGWRRARPSGCGAGGTTRRRSTPTGFPRCLRASAEIGCPVTLACGEHTDAFGPPVPRRGRRPAAAVHRRGRPRPRPLRPAEQPGLVAASVVAGPWVADRRHTPVVVCRRALRSAPLALALQGHLVPRLRPGLPVQRHRAPARRADHLDGQGHPGPPGARTAVLVPRPRGSAPRRRPRPSWPCAWDELQSDPEYLSLALTADRGRRPPGRRRSAGPELLRPGGPQRDQRRRHRAHPRGPGRATCGSGDHRPAGPDPRRRAGGHRLQDRPGPVGRPTSSRS